MANAHGTNVRRTRTYVWPTSADSPTLISTAEASVDGLQSWNTIWNNGSAITSHSQTSYDLAHGYRVVTSTAPDGSYTATTNQYGRLISTTAFDALGNQLSAIGYSYDAHGRQTGVTDARTGTTTMYFNNADQATSTKTPAPATGQSAQVTTNFLDSMGRITGTLLPDNTTVTQEYFANGLLKKTYGSRAYPVEYTYDAQGRVKTMKTWQNFSGNFGTATTTWNYDPCRGFLTNKAYADGKGPSYTYTAAGRLQTRLWARAITTTYGYNGAGDLSAIGYSDGVTPSIAYSFDRRGRQTAITNGTAVSSLVLDDAGNILSESYSGGPLDGLTVTNAYDEFLRRTNLSLLSPLSALLSSTTYSYDSASRVKAVAAGTNSATYSYLANSPLVSQISFTNGNAQRMVTTKAYDNLNRLTAISSVSSVSSVVNFSYSYNSANQRTSVTNADNAHWVYQYDSLGQVISGKKYWSDGAPVAGQQFEYTFDDIGNRKTTAAGGDNSGAALRSANYFANNLNQYTSRDVPGYQNVIGSANSNATVVVWAGTNGFAQTQRKAEYFRGELPINNSTGAVWLSITNFAALNNGTNADIVATNCGNIFMPKTAEVFGYDFDGNLTNDGRWNFTWDAENRPTIIARRTGIAGPERVIVCKYDYLGRRVEKDSLTYFPPPISSSGTTSKFVYDGWNLAAVLDQDGNPVYSFAWGTDASGSPQGAGGVGGLISMTVNSGPQAGTYFYAYDGNFNVVALINATNGAVAAQYDYGPFGEPLRATGPMAFINPFLFSTKFYDWETGFYYYGYRYYSASTGRWLSRDPIEEISGANMYALLDNDPIERSDYLGLEDAQLKTTLAQQIQVLEDQFKESGPIQALGLNRSLGDLQSTLKSAHLTVSINPGKVGAGNDALYTGSAYFGGTIYLRNSSPSVYLLIHELVHAQQSLFTPGIFTAGQAEGLAYAYEKLLEYPIPAIHNSLESVAPGCDKQAMRKAWQGFWLQYHSPESLGGGVYYVGISRASVPVNFTFSASDFKHVREQTGLGFSCKTIAEEINKILERNHCCFRVSCAKTSDKDSTIPTGVDIDSIFQ